MPTLARQQATTGNKGSLARLTQLTEQIEASLDAIHGHGVISGGFVTRTGNFAVSLATGTVLFAEGVALTLAGAAAYSSIPDHATVYLWGVITRTAADPTAPTALDTYALTVTHNTTGTAPSALHFPLATMDAAGGIGAQSDIDNNPAGKYLAIPRRVTVAVNAVAIPAVDKWYVVTADFSAVGSFAGEAAFSADPNTTAGIVAYEIPSHKTAGKAAWRVMLPASVGAAGNYDFTPVLYGDGYTGADLTDIAASWAIAAAPVETVSAVSSPAQITSNQAAYALSSGRFQRLNTDASRTIQGIVATTDGDERVIINAGSFDLVLAHQHGSASAANRLLSPTAADVTILPTESASVVYDSVTARWRIF